MQAFESMSAGPGGGAKNRLRDKVLAVIVDYGPLHNLRLLEILQQKEKQKPRSERMEWARSNCWPRVTDMTGIGGCVKDFGKFRGTWRGKKKTLHFWGVSGQSGSIPPGWEKVEPKPAKKPAAKTSEPGVPPGAKQKALF